MWVGTKKTMMVFKLDDKKLQEEVAKGVAKSLVPAIMKELLIEIKKAIFPLEIKGDSRAGEMIGVTKEGIRARRQRGFYEEGRHFYRKSDKIIIWNRDLLLEEWRKENE